VVEEVKGERGMVGKEIRRWWGKRRKIVAIDAKLNS
jgi:hypothetical protein